MGNVIKKSCEKFLDYCNDYPGLQILLYMLVIGTILVVGKPDNRILSLVLLIVLITSFLRLFHLATILLPIRPE